MKKGVLSPNRSPRRHASSSNAPPTRDASPSVRSPTALMPPTLAQVASMAGLSLLALSGDATDHASRYAARATRVESVDITESPRLDCIDTDTTLSLDPDDEELGSSDRSEEPITPTLTRKFQPLPRPVGIGIGVGTGASVSPTGLPHLSPRNMLAPLHHPHLADAFSLHTPDESYYDVDNIDDIFGASRKAGPQWDRL
eukprot:IDg17783t1